MKHYFLIAVIMLLTTVRLLSCDKDSPDTPPAPAKTEMGFIHSVNVGDSTYVSVFKDMNAGSFNTDNALMMSKGVFSFVYKGKVYTTDTEHIYKYAQKEGELVQEGNTILLPGRAAAMYITFASDHKAYVPCHGLGKAITINPTTMEKVGEIDLTEYSLGKAAGDDNPEPAASVIRNGILYVALSQAKPTYACEAGAYVALIDTKTDKPTKAVSDPRVSMAFGKSPAGDPFIDEKGDIYFYCVAMSGYQPGVKEGSLRIKKGRTDFDKSYCFIPADTNLVGVKGNRASYTYVKAYGGNGEAYAYFNIPGATSNPPDYVHDKCFQPFEVSPCNKSCAKLDPSVTAGWAVTLCKSGDDIIFGISIDQGMSYFVYHPATAIHEILKVKTSGVPYAAHELGQFVYISNSQKEQ